MLSAVTMEAESGKSNRDEGVLLHPDDEGKKHRAGGRTRDVIAQIGFGEQTPAVEGVFHRAHEVITMLQINLPRHAGGISGCFTSKPVPQQVGQRAGAEDVLERGLLERAAANQQQVGWRQRLKMLRGGAHLRETMLPARLWRWRRTAMRASRWWW